LTMRQHRSGLRLRRGIRVLLTEGSSLSARQTLYALSYTGAEVDVCDPAPHSCLARFSRLVGNCYRCPSFTADPQGYLEFLQEHTRAGAYDVLFPVHDQVYLLARCRQLFKGRVALAVPEFAALERLQSKAHLVRLLAELGLPYPPTVLVRTRLEVQRVQSFPYYVKLAYSTAGRGVWLVHDRAERDRIADKLEDDGWLDGDREILVQRPATGVLRVVQCVFQHGRLVAGHCYQARALGVGGSARARVSVSDPCVMKQMAALGAHLRWHGALTLDYIWDPGTGQPAYIDANPRIGETLNATLSGVNLCAALVQVALEAPIPAFSPSRQGTRTHSAVMALLAGAERGASRASLVVELCRSLMHLGFYARSQDEMTRPRDDPPSLIPALWLAGQVLLDPREATAVIVGAVDNYALSEPAARVIRQLGPAAKKHLGGTPSPPVLPALPRITSTELATAPA
jgi:predicted ATP-grasp superfamily ATP-dependent carboligase